MLDVTKIPFALALELPGRDYAGELEIVLGPEQGLHRHPLDDSPLTLDPSDDLTRLFAAAVDAGILGCEQTRMKLLRAGREAGHHTLVYEVRALPWESFIYLIALLMQAHYALDPLASVRVRPVAASQAIFTEHDLTHQDVRSLALGGAQAVPIQSTIDPRSERSFNVTLEFAHALSRREFENVRRGLAIWDELRMVGGFCLDLVEMEGVDPPASIVHLLPSEVLLGVEWRYTGDLAGFAGLSNYSVRLAAEGTPLTRIRIE